MSDLSPLLATLPNWFSIGTRFAHSIEGECLVVDETAVADVRYRITVEEIDGKVYARETRVGDDLPRACYNRHIMSGGHFCLGFGYGSIVRDEASARTWWSSLSEFLRLQGVAASTGRWPRHIELDHGQAGKYHRAALDAAAKVGVSEEYELALLGQPSWITDQKYKLSKDGKSLVNGRAPCPRGCTLNGRSILRRDCCSGDAVATLIRSERAREIALAAFWDSVRSDKGMTCCDTMFSCPLREAIGVHDAE